MTVEQLDWEDVTLPGIAKGGDLNRYGMSEEPKKPDTARVSNGIDSEWTDFQAHLHAMAPVAHLDANHRVSKKFDKMHGEMSIAGILGSTRDRSTRTISL